MLKLYNSLSRKKEIFVPLKGKEVTMYVCGITPYDTTHLGHAFTYVWFDVLVRYLTFKGYRVKYLQNVTDIDDDILKRAREEKRDWKELGDYWTNRFLQDMKSLNVLPSTFYVKATDSIGKIVEIVKLLIERKYAYEKDGNVYFDVTKFKSYGELSGFNEKQMLILFKERGGNPGDSLKKNPLDFVLWQRSKVNEPFWSSPWGRGEPHFAKASRGKPGWHIECSALIHKYLGEQIDIHGGGRDLIFPHHESEVAQSEPYTNKKPFVNFWMHTGMVQYLGEKMAKTLGNMVMIDGLLQKYSANAIRFTLLSHHYRSPWEFFESEVKEAEEKLSKITKKNDKKAYDMFISQMDDDLNVPKILDSSPSKEILSILGFSFT